MIPGRTASVGLVRTPGLADGIGYASAATTSPAGLLFTAGACPLDADGAIVAPGDVAAQTARAMINLVAALAAGGCSLADVAKSTVYVATSDRYDLVDAWRVVRSAFGDHEPPSTLLGVALLGYPGQLVEIEAVAVRSRDI